MPPRKNNKKKNKKSGGTSDNGSNAVTTTTTTPTMASSRSSRAKNNNSKNKPKHFLAPSNDSECVHRDIREPWLTDPVCEAAMDLIRECWGRMNGPAIAQKVVELLPASVNNQNTIACLKSLGTNYLLDQSSTPEKQEQRAKCTADLINSLEIRWALYGCPIDKCIDGEKVAQVTQRTGDLANLDSRLKLVHFFNNEFLVPVWIK
jgi:hypothetical protein